jgi:hypothetical protein
LRARPPLPSTAAHSWEGLAAGTWEGLHPGTGGGDGLGVMAGMTGDARACARCGLNDGLSPGLCAFHPALMPDPGPLLFGPDWHACGAAGHRAADAPCVQRTAHTYPEDFAAAVAAAVAAVAATAAADLNLEAAEEEEEVASCGSNSPAPLPRTWLPTPLVK